MGYIDTARAERASGAQMDQLRKLAIEVRRTIPRGYVTAAEADALIAEFERLPRLGNLKPHETPAWRERQAQIQRRRKRGRRGHGKAAEAA